ncbi:MAG: hypothetical protein D6685_17200, partial [Bacteroidetes bacterium]
MIRLALTRTEALALVAVAGLAGAGLFVTGALTGFRAAAESETVLAAARQAAVTAECRADGARMAAEVSASAPGPDA